MTSQAKQRSRLTILKFIAFTFFFFLFLIWGIGEIFARLTAEASPYKAKSEISDEIGWITRADLDLKYEGKDLAGVKYPVHYQTTRDGFRIFGDVNTTKKKVFFVGDSYVQSVEVSNDKLFYQILADSLGFEVWAIGQAGFGTLQEKLIIDKYIDEIKPDLLVLESCDNDFIDNYAPLEYHSTYKVGLRRPYMTLDGDIEYRKPVPRWQEWNDKSAFLKLLRMKFQTAFPSDKGHKSERRISREKRAFDKFDASCKVTKLIVADIKKRIGNTKMIGFTASAYQPQLTEMNNIFTELEIPFVSKTSKRIDSLKFKKFVCNSSDGFHWNEFGHRVIAETLKEIISSHLNEEKVEE